MSGESEDIRKALQAVYDATDADVARFGPVCAVSGRCCRFDEYGHTLFVTDLEVEVLLLEAPRPSRPLDDGATCPWQDFRGRCTAREARPLGCRVYFCDPGYQDHLSEVAEASIARIKRMVDEQGLSWDYAPLHRHLRRAQDEGRFPSVAGQVERGSNADQRANSGSGNLPG